jgi:hypothetical protein
MKRLFVAAAVLAGFAFSAMAQDWYHDREERFRGEEWRAHLFDQVRMDIDHVWAGRASEHEMTRLAKTKEELQRMQADLDVGRWDHGILNDVMDSIRKSTEDTRLTPRDRDVLADDLVKLKEFQEMHNHR